MISIPNYTIKKEIGRGGMATVYLAIQDKLKRKVALKVMTPEMAKDENFRNSFMSEATIIASLDHPNIVRIYDVEIVNDETLYMAMEYLSGDTLKAKIIKGKLPFSESIEVIQQISLGLTHAHKKGYIHRDIKPGNILFRSDGTAVLTDFGIAKLQDTSGELTRMGFTMGTLQYMSPEQVVTTDLDQRSDIYSLGLVFYEMLTGLKAFRAESTVQAIHQHTTVPPPKLEPEYSYLQEVLDKVLAKKPEDRYQTVIEFIDALKEANNVDKTVIHRVIDDLDEDDKTRVFIPENPNKSPEKKVSAEKKKPLVAILGGLALVGVSAFAVLKFVNFNENTVRNDQNGSILKKNSKPTKNEITGSIPVNKIETESAERKTDDKSKTRLVTYFHEPQINYTKLENELEALKKTAMTFIEFSPENEKSKEMLQLILNKYKLLAKDSIKSMEQDRARIIIEKGLEISKNDKELQGLKALLDTNFVPNKTQKKQISALLLTAKKQIEKGNYVLPKGDNALETYQDILLIDVDNEQTLEKIGKIKEIFENGINGTISQDLYAANSLVNQARALFPYDEKFIQLQQKIRVNVGATD